MPATLPDQQAEFEHCLTQAPPRLASVSYINIFAWQDFFRFDFKMIDDCLCVFAANEMGVFLYMPPLGAQVTPDVIKRCFARMREANGAGGVTRIENVSADQLSFFDEGAYTYHLKDHEYCYYRRDIADLSGSRYSSKRSSYNQFVTNYTHAYKLFEASMIEECLALYEVWAAERIAKHPDDLYGHMLAENKQVHRRVLENVQTLNITGRVVLVDGDIKAYTFGFPVNSDMFCVLFEVADLSTRGLAGYIFREFCRDAAVAPYKFINAMEDMGMEHMRAAKMSYHPTALLPSYTVTLKD